MLKIGNIVSIPPHIMQKATRQLAVTDDMLDVLEEHEVRFEEVDEHLDFLKTRLKERMLHNIIRKDM